MLSLKRPIVTLRDLQTDYGTEDLYNLLEIGMVNAHNERVAAKIAKRREREAARSGG